jgi:2'-5' RNA ligase
MTVAIDIAILPPAEVSARAIALSAALPDGESQGLRLGADCLPHITLTQQFVPADRLDVLLAAVDRAVREAPPLRLCVTGGAKGSSSVSMSIERTPELVALHEQLLHATKSFEGANGDASAFLEDAWVADMSHADRRARDRDIDWVRDFRRQSSFDRYTPHITLGHALAAPSVEPIDFVATRIAVCHLGRFCTCRRILRAWDIGQM